MHSANPLCIRKVYSNWSRWVRIARFSSNVNHFVSNSFYFFLLVFRKNRGVVFEPLCVLHHYFHAITRFEVVDLNNAFVRTTLSKRIVIDFHKTVNEINVTFSCLHPLNVEVVPSAQISSCVEFNQLTKCNSLLVVLRYFFCFIQPEYNLL